MFSSAPRISEVAKPLVDYLRVELQFRPQTIEKYDYCLRRIQSLLGDRSVTEISAADVTAIKSNMKARGNGVCWQVCMLAVVKRLLHYCGDQLGLAVLDAGSILIPKRPRRKVVYLTGAEVERFVQAIPLTTQRNQPHEHGLRFRALVEALLGSAMRIGELLSLNRADIDFERKEARVIGKGNKERTVFFSDRALSWLKRYLETRTDSHPALFISQNGRTRLSRTDVWRPFQRYRGVAGLNKPVRPHLLRHTAATQLLFNGCPVGHIKEILGHERLETTCRYYLGLDLRAAKLAHEKYLVYDPAPDQGVDESRVLSAASAPLKVPGLDVSLR